jgi:hypothetical protein
MYKVASCGEDYIYIMHVAHLVARQLEVNKKHIFLSTSIVKGATATEKLTSKPHGSPSSFLSSYPRPVRLGRTPHMERLGFQKIYTGIARKVGQDGGIHGDGDFRSTAFRGMVADMYSSDHLPVG